MAPNAKQRPGRGQGAAQNIRDDVHPHRTRRIDVELDRAAEVVACSSCHLDREALGHLLDLAGGASAIVEALSSIKTAWAELFTAVLRIHDAHDVVVAADEPGLLVALSGVQDLVHLDAYRDPEPIAEVLANKVTRIAVAVPRRELAGAALAVAVNLDRGELPNPCTWTGLRDGVDALLGLEDTWTP